MIIVVTFPDSQQETFLSVLQASYAIGISPPTILHAINIGKRKIIRKRDKAEFQIEAEDYPRIKLQKEDGEVFVFSNLRDTEDYFDLPHNSPNSKISKNDPSIISKKTELFFNDLNPFPRNAEEKRVLFQRTSRGPQYHFQGHYKEKLALVKQYSPFEYDVLKNYGRV